MARKKKQKKYIGPYFVKGFVDNKGTHNPDKMTDQQISAFIKNHPYAKEWWSEEDAKG